MFLMSSGLTGLAFNNFNYHLGMAFFDFFLVGGVAYCVFKGIRTLRKEAMRGWALMAAIFFVYFAFALGTSTNLRYVVKDFRPLVIALHCLVFLTLSRTIDDKEFISNLLVNSLYVAFATTLVGMLLVLSNVYVPEDAFFAMDDLKYRFISTGYYLGAVVLLFFPARYFKATKNSQIWISLCAIGLLLASGARTMVALVAILLPFLRASNIRRLAFGVFLSVGLIVGFSTFSNYVLKNTEVSSDSRLEEGSSAEGVGAQLLVRMSPGIEKIDEMRPINHVFGLGMGTTFYIPWFEFRDLDSLSVEVDDNYITFYAKYGLVGIFIILLFTHLVVGDFHIKARVAAWLLILFSGITTAFQYEPHSVGLFIPLLCCAWIQDE